VTDKAITMMNKKQLQKKEYERMKALRDKVKDGKATFAERNYLKMHDKKKNKK